MSRPVKQIDPATVEKLASIHCTVEEIAAVVGCSKDTLERRFAAHIQKGRLTANASLKRKQFELAMAGNVAMLIWLGKQALGQSDRPEQPPPKEASIPAAARIALDKIYGSEEGRTQS